MEERSTRSTHALALAALILLTTFPVVVIVLNLVQRARYDALSQPMSQLALDDGGWLMVVGFCGLAGGTLVLAYVIRRTVNQAGAAVVVLVVAGLLGFVAAAFPTDGLGEPFTARGLLHNFAGLASFLLYATAIVLSGLSFRKTQEWKSFSRPTLAWSVGAFLALLLMFVLGGVGLFGIGQRIEVATWLSWLLLVSWRLHNRHDLSSEHR